MLANVSMYAGRLVLSMFYDREIKITCWSSATRDFGTFEVKTRVNHELNGDRRIEKGVTRLPSTVTGWRVLN